MFCSPVKEVQNPDPVFFIPSLFPGCLKPVQVCGWTGRMFGRSSKIICQNSPGHLHGVLGEIDDPVDQVEGAERKREEDARVLVDDAGAGQDVVGWHGRALLQEGLGVDRRVGEGFGGSVKQRRRIHSFLEHGAGVHLRETETAQS